jgi:hypothetical protein
MLGLANQQKGNRYAHRVVFYGGCMLNSEQSQQYVPTQRVGNPELDSTFLFFVNHLDVLRWRGKVTNADEISSAPVDNFGRHR